jgi:hypothetical protein
MTSLGGCFEVIGGVTAKRRIYSGHVNPQFGNLPKKATLPISIRLCSQRIFYCTIDVFFPALQQVLKRFFPSRWMEIRRTSRGEI